MAIPKGTSHFLSSCQRCFRAYTLHHSTRRASACVSIIRHKVQLPYLPPVLPRSAPRASPSTRSTTKYAALRPTPPPQMRLRHPPPLSPRNRVSPSVVPPLPQ